MVITNNLAAMNANRMYSITTKSQAKSSEKLASGYKINRAADDAAGLTISEKMRSQIRSLNQGSDNIQDGISMVQVADGALAEVEDMIHRMTELSVKAANGTNTSADRQAMQQEVDQITKEINRIAKTTTFNTYTLFDADESTFTSPMTSLISSKAAEDGYLTEAYYSTATGQYHPSAILDFSSIDDEKIKYTYDKSFSFVCGYGCGETFRFTMKNGGGNSVDKQGRLFQYNVDVSGITSGSALARQIEDCVKLSPYTASPTISDTTQVSHAQAIKAEGDKLILLDTDARYNSEAGAMSRYPRQGWPSLGAVDASELMGVYPKDFMTEYPVQCSNVPGDVEMIHTYKMNAKLLKIDPLDISTQEAARVAIAKTEKALASVSKLRSGFGADQNRLEHSYANNRNKAENTQAAESRIRDTDMASEMVRYSNNGILLQAGQSMLAQANQSTQGVLSLLQ